MTSMFGRVRLRLVGWSMLVLSLILVTISAVLYVSLNRTLMSAVDAQLESASESAQLELREPGGIDELQREGSQAGLLYLVLDSHGAVVGDSQGIDVQVVPPSLLSNDSVAFASVDVPGTELRLRAQRLVETGGESLTLIAGMSLVPAKAAAHELVLTILTCGAAGLMLSFAGAWFLAARALVPIQQAFERQQEFVADASHELRTPLTILHSAADVLAREPDRADPSLVLEIRDEIVRMERLTRDLLTLARSDRGELRLSVGRLELGQLAQDLGRRIALLAEARCINVAVQKADGPVIIEGDPDRFQEVGLILLDNALRHTQPGGRIILTVERRAGDGVLVVEDTGEGIPEEHLTRVFDRFHRVDPARDRRAGGAGLGLAIAQTIVAAHNGTISLGRRPGGGTQVTVRVPALTDASSRDSA